MENSTIFQIASTYRTAILEAKQNNEFGWRDRMHNFPDGCCDDSCDLLAVHLYETYGLHSQQGNGIYYDDNDPENNTNHAWLILDDNTIIDITADQFEFFVGHSEGVYVGKNNAFYKQLDRIQIFENYNIKQCERLWDDYLIINKYLTV